MACHRVVVCADACQDLVGWDLDDALRDGGAHEDPDADYPSAMLVDLQAFDVHESQCD